MLRLIIKHLFLLVLICSFISCARTQTVSKSENDIGIEYLKATDSDSALVILNLVFTIEQPVENVFAYLIDPTSVPEWQTDIFKQVKITNGPIRTGTRLCNTKKSLWSNYKFKREIIDFIPFKTFSFYNFDKSLEFKMRYDLKRIDDATKMTITGEFKKPIIGLYKFMPQWILKYGIEKVFLYHHKLLKNNIEKKFL